MDIHKEHFCKITFFRTKVVKEEPFSFLNDENISNFNPQLSLFTKYIRKCASSPNLYILDFTIKELNPCLLYIKKRLFLCLLFAILL